ncbi:ribonuclease H-like domain-containing protein [Tanacetum coccineum]
MRCMMVNTLVKNDTWILVPSPVVKPATIRTVLSLAVSQNRAYSHLMFKECILLSEVFVWFEKQAPVLGLPSGLNVAYLLIYVDDIILTASSRCLLQQWNTGVVANVIAEMHGFVILLRDSYTLSSFEATMVYCDNVSAVYMSANPVQHQRTKHIEIDIHFVRDMVKAGHVRVFHVPSRFQYTDIFTKGLPSALFEDFRSSLSVRPPPAPTAGAY